jgi:hypothetical protein
MAPRPVFGVGGIPDILIYVYLKVDKNKIKIIFGDKCYVKIC